MKKTRISLLALMLALIMVVGVFASCNGTGGDNASEKASEAVTSADTSAETTAEATTEAQTTSTETQTSATETETTTTETEASSTETVTTETESSETDTETTVGETETTTTETETATTETEEVLDTSALTIEVVDRNPDFVEHETASAVNERPVQVRVEAEDYLNSTIPWAEYKGTEFSDGVLMRGLTSKNNTDLQGNYYVEYIVNVPVAGEYDFTILSTNVGSFDWTTNYKYKVNDGKEVNAVEVATVVSDFPSATLGDSGLLKILNIGRIELNEGDNTIRITLDNSDLNTIQWGPRIAFFMDYFEVSRGSGSNSSVSIEYATAVKGDNSDILTAAAKVNVYDVSTPIKFTYVDFFAEAGSKEYSIIDYFGNVVYSGTVEGQQYDYVTLERTIKNHPTGFFTFVSGDLSFDYVVTPALSERKNYEDSPFAMDFASYYKIRDLNKMYSVASAARLSGVTWVRERSHWEYYEKNPGEYDFSSTDKHFRTIKKAGLKLLSILYVSPQWAIENLGTTDSRVGGFADTQLEVYDMMYALADHYNGIVDAWEIWNESDGGFALETAEQYVAWYKAAALGAVAADPNLIVSHGGFCIPNENQGSDYVHLSFMNEMLLYTSVFNYHSHTPQSGDLHNVDYRKTGMAKFVYPSMALYGALDKPIWVTEAGMRIESHNPTAEEKNAQTPYIITSTVQSLAMGTDKHYWFLLAPLIEGSGDFGTFSKELDPYPTLAAEAVMTKVLGKGEYLGELEGLSGASMYGPYGIVFNTGSRIASVLWLIGDTEYEYTFDAELPVIVTDMMGGETLVYPTDGKITVTITEKPIYITYSTPPAYVDGRDDREEIEPLVFTDAEKIVLSPEFEKFDINADENKTMGHLISNGLRVKVRVTNFNDYAITGTVNAYLEGLIIDGCDTVITVEPHSEAFVELTLFIDVDGEINDYLTFVGNFNEMTTTKAVAHVHTEGAVKLDTIYDVKVEDARQYKANKLENIVVLLDGNMTGEFVVLLDETEIESERVVYDDAKNRLNLDLSNIEAGNYVLTIARKTDTGYYDFKHLLMYFDGEIVEFRFP